MTKEQIIQMAREAGIVYDDKAAPFYERFAQLVAAAATEAANARANASWTLMCEKMVAAERERFAEECIDLVASYGGPVDLEAAIRARGQQ